MQELLELILDGFFEHWAKVAVGALLMAIGWLVGWYRARRRWQRKEFFERINFSLNSIQNDKLLIRTIMEKSCDDVFLNKVAVSRLLESALKTSEKDPIVPLAKDDYWYYLNAVLNEVSEKFAAGFIRRDIGQKVESNCYLLCLTNEMDGAIRTRKLRAMMILAKDLENLPEEMPKLESKNHETRWRTLQTMAKRLAEKPHQFLRVELVI